MSDRPLFLALVADFHQQNVSYCYWKSTRRIHAALSGTSDLDLLVARGDQHRAAQIALSRGFKFFAPVAHRTDPSVSDFLGYDEESGCIVHLHLHFRVIIGRSLLKEYRLPWEPTLLKHAIFHQDAPIKVLDPACEALLIFVRACLELQRSDPVVLRHWALLRKRFALDLGYIAAQADAALLRARAGEMFSREVAMLVTDAILGRPGFRAAEALRSRLRKELRPYRTFNALEAAVRSFGRAAFWAVGCLNEHALHQPRPWRRRAPGGGFVMAVLGVDGSGKTTVVAAARAWLSPEVDVMPLYFGTGDGRPTLLLLPFKMMLPLITALFRTKPKGASHGAISNAPPGPLYSFLMMNWAGILSLEKRTKLVAARRGADRGLVVLADRYPQNEIPDYNDGPLLHRLNWAPQWLKDFENRSYALSRRLPPDLVIKLEVTPETAERREPKMNPVTIRERIKEARLLTFPGARVVRIDSTQPIEHVLRIVRREIWRAL